MPASYLKKLSAVSGVCLIAIGCTLPLAGCWVKRPPPVVVKKPAPVTRPQGYGYKGFYWVHDRNRPMPGPVAGIDHASIASGSMGDGMAYVVWTDIYQASGGGGAGSGYPDYQNVAYSANFSKDGKTIVEVQCKTPDGKSGSCQVNGQAFDLAAGSLILVSTTGPEIRLKQLQRDTLQMQPEVETFRELAGTDAEIQAFFSPGTESEKPQDRG